MQLIEKLEWDSDFFGLNIGRSVISDEQSFDVIRFLQEARSNYDMVYIFSYHLLNHSTIHNSNLELVDIMLSMSMPFVKNSREHFAYDLRTELSPKEIEECYAIAEQTAVVSRFYNEPLIGPEKAKALYRKWIDNSLNKSFTDGILLTKSHDSITGIHVVKTDQEEKTGHCSLIGVNNKFKGTGIGKQLWEQAFGYWNQFDSISKCKVPFSLKNTESFNFHLKIGFNKVEEIKYIYHFRNNNNT